MSEIPNKTDYSKYKNAYIFIEEKELVYITQDGKLEKLEIKDKAKALEGLKKVIEDIEKTEGYSSSSHLKTILSRRNKNEYLLHNLWARITSNEGHAHYRLSTTTYRNRNFIHREHDPIKINDGDLYYPNIDIAKKTLLSLFLLLIKLAKIFPKKEDKINCEKFSYFDSNDPDEIVTLIKKSFPKLC